MQKREKVLTVVATGTFLLFVANQFLCTAPTKSSAANRKTTPPAASTLSRAAAAGPQGKTDGAAGAGERLPRPRPGLLRTGDEPHVRFAVWGRDPFHGAYQLFAEAGAAHNDSSDIRLHGIAWKDGEGLALLGDAILRKGEGVGNLEVLDIRKDRVLCRLNGEVVTLVLDRNGAPGSTP